MPYIKCSTDECPNYMKVADRVCEVCKSKAVDSNSKPTVDNNKYLVERDLLPILKTLSLAAIQSLTQKEYSFDLLGLRMPLLVECSELGRDACKKEIVRDVSMVYRYYVQPYDIDGKKYHICSQWWSVAGNNSKDILKLLKEIKE